MVDKSKLSWVDIVSLILKEGVGFVPAVFRGGGSEVGLSLKLLK